VGESLRIPFALTNSLSASATISTRSGVVLSREYLFRTGAGVVEWVPEEPGTAVLRIRAQGHQGQTTTRRVGIMVLPRPERPPAPELPSVAVLSAPDVVTVGTPAEIALRADDCEVAVARIEGPGDAVQSWRFSCPAHGARFEWTPSDPGRHQLTVLARAAGTTAVVTTRFTVQATEGPLP
jgi:hypothetical protein